MKPSRRTLSALALGGALLTGGSLAATYRRDIPKENLNRRYHDEKSNFVGLDSITLHYRDTGNGSPLLLLHGIGSSLHTWSGWSEVLRDEYRLIAPDLPGFGLTGPRDDNEYTTRRYVETLENFLDHLQIKKVSLAGNSFGGFLALRYALRNPERVKKIVLMNTIGLQSSWPLPFRLGQYPGLGRLRKCTPKFLVEALLKYGYGNSSKVEDNHVERYYELLLREGNRDAMVKLIQQTYRNYELRFEGELRNLTLPVLIQWGLRDPWLPITRANQFRKRLPDASLVTYLEAGHVPMEEIPRQTAQDAHAFLSG